MELWELVPPALVSAAISAGMSYFVSRRTIRQNEWSARVDEVTRALSSMSENTIAYWTKNLKPEELLTLSVTIKNQFQDVTSQLEDLRARDDIHGFDNTLVDIVHGEVFDLTTGADFDSPNRVADANRAQNAAAKISELRILINRCRRRGL